MKPIRLTERKIIPRHIIAKMLKDRVFKAVGEKQHLLQKEAIILIALLLIRNYVSRKPLE